MPSNTSGSHLRPLHHCRWCLVLKKCSIKSQCSHHTSILGKGIEISIKWMKFQSMVAIRFANVCFHSFEACKLWNQKRFLWYTCLVLRKMVRSMWRRIWPASTLRICQNIDGEVKVFFFLSWTEDRIRCPSRDRTSLKCFRGQTALSHVKVFLSKVCPSRLADSWVVW